MLKLFQKFLDLFKKHPKLPEGAKKTEQEFWKECLDEVKSGKRPDPLMLTANERHSANTLLISKLRWSKDFVYRMRTPLRRQIAETGHAANLVGGVNYSTPEAYTSLKDLETKNSLTSGTSGYFADTGGDL